MIKRPEAVRDVSFDELCSSGPCVGYLPQGGMTGLVQGATASQPASPAELGAHDPPRAAMAPTCQDHASLPRGTLCRSYLRQEPSAGIPHAGICAWGGPQGRSLSRPTTAPPFRNWAAHGCLGPLRHGRSDPSRASQDRRRRLRSQPPPFLRAASPPAEASHGCLDQQPDHPDRSTEEILRSCLKGLDTFRGETPASGFHHTVGRQNQTPRCRAW